MVKVTNEFHLINSRHPDYLYEALEWEAYRDTFRGGEHFRDHYLRKLSTDESQQEYERRKDITPIPAFAKQAVLEVRNSIYQRLADVTRKGGTESYQQAMQRNVDRENNSMNEFIGVKVLTELLVMGRVGIYVDAPDVLPTTLSERVPSPYLYHYAVEDILSWEKETEEELGQFRSVLLRDRVVNYKTHYGKVQLPSGERKERYRLLYRDPDDFTVRVKMFNDKEEVMELPGSEPDGSIILDLPYIPFLMPDIGGSLLKDVWTYQVTLLNLLSGAVNFDLSSNVPYLTIQTDLRTAGSHLKKPNAPNGPEAGNQQSSEAKEKIGSTRGRYYDKDVDRPDFIAPPAENLLASLKLQDKLQDDIRRMVNLAVEGKAGSRTESGEAKKISAQGLEAGLSYIGTVLQGSEQRIAEIWAHYENKSRPQIAAVAYPARYALKSDEERLDEAEKLMTIADKTPSQKAKREVYKRILTLMLEDRVTPEELRSMHNEVDNAKYTRTDLDFIIEARKEGLVSDETASQALGFASGEVEKAAEDHAERLERILKSQSRIGEQNAGGASNAAARGVSDLDPGGNRSDVDQESRNSSENSEE